MGKNGSKTLSKFFSLLLLFCSPLGWLEADKNQLDKQLAIQDSIFRASTFQQLGSGNFDSAILLGHAGVSFVKKHSPERKLLIGKRFNFLAYLYDVAQSKKSTLDFCDSAIAYFNLADDTLSSGLVYSFWLKGVQFQKIGDFTRAEVMLSNAYEIAKQTNYRVDEIKIELGTVKGHIGDHKEAKALYIDVLSNNSGLRPEVELAAKANLADLYISLNDMQNANRLWRTIKEDMANVKHIEPAFQVGLLHIQAQLLKGDTQYDNAIKALQQARSLFNQTEGGNRELAKILCAQSELYLLDKNPSEALESSRLAEQQFNVLDANSMGVAQQLGDPFYMVSCYLQGLSYKELYKESKESKMLDSAFNYAVKVQQIAQKMRQGFLYQNSKFMLAEYLVKNTELGMDCAYEKYLLDSTEQHKKDIFFFMEQSRSLVLQDEMDERQASNPTTQKLLGQLSRKEIELQEVRNKVQKNALSQTIDSIRNVIKTSQFEGVEDIDALGNIYNQLQKTTSIEGVSVQFSEGKDHLYVMTFEGDKVSVNRLKVNKNQLAKMVDTFKLNLLNLQIDPAKYAYSAWELYSTLFSQLDITAKKISIVPSGILNNIPFNALVFEYDEKANYKSIQYLAKRYQINYQLSGTLMCNASRSVSQQIEGMSAIILKESEEGNLNEHFTLLQDVVSQLGGELYDEQKLTFSMLDEQPRLIHFSSHGFFNKEDPNESYIQLPDSDSLTLKRIYANPSFAHAPFIVLNACETGLGKHVTGEGISNFTRAFMYSGATGVIESTWKISASSTATIFKYFYQNIASGKATNIALSEATLAYLEDENVDNQLAHPFFWAGFRHFGNAKTVKASGSLVKGIWLVGIGMALLVLIMSIVSFKRFNQ